MLEGKFLDFIFMNYGIVGVLTVMGVIAVLKFGNPIKGIKRVIGWFKSTTPQIHYVPRDILLSKLDYWLNFKIQTIRMNDKARQMMFRDLLQIKFDEFREFVEYTTKSIHPNMPGPEIHNLVVERFNESIDDYERKAIGMGMPEVVVVKYSEWQQRTYDYILHSVNMICMSNTYESNETRLNAIYMLITSMLEVTIAEAESTLKELNGELTGEEYKGVICG